MFEPLGWKSGEFYGWRIESESGIAGKWERERERERERECLGVEGADLLTRYFIHLTSVPFKNIWFMIKAIHIEREREKELQKPVPIHMHHHTPLPPPPPRPAPPSTTKSMYPTAVI